MPETTLKFSLDPIEFYDTNKKQYEKKKKQQVTELSIVGIRIKNWLTITHPSMQAMHEHLSYIEQ